MATTSSFGLCLVRLIKKDGSNDRGCLLPRNDRDRPLFLNDDWPLLGNDDRLLLGNDDRPLPRKGFL